MKEQLELQRSNCTPAQFLTYVRSQIRKHKFTGILADDIDLEYFKRGNDLNFDCDNKDNPDAPCRAEKSVSKPYEMQTYIRGWDGSVYNHIMEFTFDDEKTGHGYFFFLNAMG